MYVPRARLSAGAAPSTLQNPPHKLPAPRAPSTAHVFHPLPALSLRTDPPRYRYPHIVATYSHHPDRHISHDDASMPYYKPCPVGADLNYGFAKRVERTGDEEEHLDGLCEALQRTWTRYDQAKVASDGTSDGVEQGERTGGVITWRGMLTRIMTAPFDRDPWEMTAIALDGSVYIELYEPPDVRAASKKRQSAWAMQSYWGVAYESYATETATASDGAGSVAEGRPEGWSGDWCNVVRSSIGEIPVCIGGEVDCVEAEIGSPHPGLLKCMELKTNGPITNPHQERTFHRKLLKHWAQSYLLGIPKVEVGFRDEGGIVRSWHMFDTLSIPRLIEVAPEPQPVWHPTPALTFLESTLAVVLEHVLPTDPAPAWRARLRAEGGDAGTTQLPPATVWRFSFVPRRGCELWCVGEYPFEGEGERDDGKPERWGGVLREEYVRWRLARGL